jgi:hypothetical protein
VGETNHTKRLDPESGGSQKEKLRSRITSLGVAAILAPLCQLDQGEDFGLPENRDRFILKG